MSIRSSQSEPSASKISYDEARKRMQRHIGLGRTTYRNQFGHTDGEPAIKTLPDAFGGIIRSGFQPHLAQWQRSAGEDKVKALAETCRSLRTWSATMGPQTTHKHIFPSYPNAEFRPPPEKTNKQNTSAVPLGNLYSTTQAELQVEAARKAAKQAELDVARTREEDIRTGKAAEQSKVSFKLCFDMAPPDPSCQQCLGAGGLNTSNLWKSESKSTFLASSHSLKQRRKFLHQPPPKKGERECREYEISVYGPKKYSQSMPDLGQSV